MSRFRTSYRSICHFLTARHTRGFGVHSPFLFRFTRFVLREKHPFYAFQAIENLQKALKTSGNILTVSDIQTRKITTTTIAQHAREFLHPVRFDQLLFRIVSYFKAHNVLEIGTSLGISTAYLVSASSEIECVSLQTSIEIANLAQKNLQTLNISNVRVIAGNTTVTLSKTLSETEKLDIVYFNVGQYSDSVLHYLELCLPKTHKETVMIFGNIHQSKNAENTWKSIQNHAQTNSSIDLFHLGIVFFNDDLHKKHYKMRY